MTVRAIDSMWKRMQAMLTQAATLLLLWPSLACAVASGVEPADSLQPPDQALSAQGPALAIPQEVLEMLDQRKRVLDKKEEALRLTEARLASLKSEIEGILARHEQALKLAEQARQSAEQTKAATAQKQAKVDTEAFKAEQAKLAKMYETMPAEEAAARIEKMPRDRALELLRLLKGKTAGAILAQVTPAKAAKLTEQLIPKQH